MRHFRVPAAIIIGVCISIGLSTPVAAQKRVALVIGNSAYKNVVKLPNPVSDAKDMADLFRKSGFNSVETLNDVTGVQLRRAVREFTNIARDADIAIVFFAGHGIEVGGTNYLIPVDAKLSTDLDAEDEAVSLDRVVRALEPAKRLRMVILDACRDNPFVKSMQRTLATRSIGRGLAQVEPAGSDTLIAFAAKAGSTAEDGSGRHSPFTTALLKHISEPGLDVRLAFGRVRDEVMRSTSSRQEPFVYGSLGGSTVALVPLPPTPAPARVAAPQPSAPAIDDTAGIRRDFELAAQIGTKEAWDSFLALRSEGYYADLARAARAKILAGEKTQSGERGKQVIAALPTNSADMIKSLQGELKRVGCYSGEIDGRWSGASQRSLGNFNQHARTKIDTRHASLDALDAIKSRSERVCPLTCGRDQRAEGEQCVAIVCPEHQFAGDDGGCHERHKPVAKPHAAPKREVTRQHGAPRARPSRQPNCAPNTNTSQGSALIVCR